MPLCYAHDGATVSLSLYGLTHRLPKVKSNGSNTDKLNHVTCKGPPLWSSGQSSWLQIRRSRVRFLALQKKKQWVWNGVHSAS
jgi:hypothetical protein